MSTAMPPLAPEAPTPQQPAGLSEGSRLINIFFSPRKTFEDIRRKSSWWAPWVVVSLFTLLSASVVVQKVDLYRLAEKRMEMTKIGQQQMEQASPEQKDRLLTVQVVGQKVSQFARPIFLLVIGIIVSAVLLGIFNFGFDAGIKFSAALAVFFYAFLPFVIRNVLITLSLLASSDPSGFDPDINPIATNPAFFMERESHKFLYGLASSLDVINLWVMVLLGLGCAVVATNRKVTPRTAILTMLVLYFGLNIIFAAVGAAF